MQTDNTTQLPLYKVLDEKRTQGKWFVDNEDIFKVSAPSGGVAFTITKNGKTSEDIANAAFTALAVNNLSSLADALEKLVDRIDNSWEVITSGKQNGLKSALIREAKEALQRIS